MGGVVVVDFGREREGRGGGIGGGGGSGEGMGWEEMGGDKDELRVGEIVGVGFEVGNGVRGGWGDIWERGEVVRE